MGPLARPWALPARDGARACDISVRRIGGRRAAVGFSPAGRARGWRSVRALGVGKEPDHEPTTTGRDAARDADVPSTSVGGGGARVAMTPDKAAALRLRVGTPMPCDGAQRWRIGPCQSHKGTSLVMPSVPGGQHR